jgi:hypothetical protein
LSTVPAPRRAPSADDAALRSDARPPTAVASQPAQATGGIDAEPAQALEVRGAPNVEATT